MKKQTAKAKAHELVGHASGRRVHGWKMQEENKHEMLADLHCVCTICAGSRLQAQSLRKFEGTCTPMISGKYLISTDPYILNAMNALRKLDEIEQKSDKEESLTLPVMARSGQGRLNCAIVAPSCVSIGKMILCH